MPKRNRQKLVLYLTLLFALLAGGGTWLSWDHVRFAWLFQSLGRNAQGYPEYRHRRTGIVMVRLPGGTFWMGAQRDDPKAPNHDPEADMAGGGEHIVHAVTLSPFLIGKHEVTQAEWKAVMGSNPSHFQGRYALRGVDAGSLPVDSVYRDELEVEGGFLERTGLELPTEAQWEYACRAGREGPVPGDLDEMAWYDDGPASSNRPITFPAQPAPPPAGKTHPAGTKKPNGFGLHDMLGNVEEWVADSWNVLFYEESSGSRDPVFRGPAGTDGVFRGGGWNDSEGGCRCGKRGGWRTNESRVPHLGFRVAYYPVP